MIAEAVYQDIITFDPPDGMLHEDADLADGLVDGLLRVRQVRIGMANWSPA